MFDTLVAGLGPKLTVAPVRFVPVTVTTVPPVDGPSVGAIEETAGGVTTVRTTVVGLYVTE